jgi:hypothetical protein
MRTDQYKLLSRLGEASKGHIAVNGDQGPNLFADAAKELERLYEIESLVRAVFRPIALQDNQYYTTTAEATQNRLENGRKLGIAVGAINPDGSEASK